MKNSEVTLPQVLNTVLIHFLYETHGIAMTKTPVNENTWMILDYDSPQDLANFFMEVGKLEEEITRNY